MHQTIRIRPAVPRDDTLLAHIERRAAERFREAGLAAIADGSVNDLGFVQSCRRHGVLIVAVDDRDVPVGFAMAGELDGALHVYELSVVPEYGRQGIGSRLMAAIEGAARSKRMPALTLSTFSDVPWNRPFYERLGFAFVRKPRWTPGFHVLRAIEEAVGLPVERRVFLRKDLG